MAGSGLAAATCAALESAESVDGSTVRGHELDRAHQALLRLLGPAQAGVHLTQIEEGDAAAAIDATISNAFRDIRMGS